MREVGRPRMLSMFAGTFMHELGHNLGLHHGGDSDENYKPNYISVMNYAFQFGIPYAAVPGSIHVAGFRIDYSDTALPTLDEAHLDETLGVQAGTTDIIWHSGNACPDCGYDFGYGPATGPIDWNLNGDATERDVAADINVEDHPYTPDSYFYSQLTGF